MADDPIFRRRGQTYQGALFGLGAANPDHTQSPYQICLRYEFENKTSEVIQELRWPQIGLYVSSVEPGQRIRIPRTKDANTADVAEFSTQLYAFENIAATSRSVFPSRTSPDPPVSNPAPDRLFHFSLADRLPAVAEGVPATLSIVDATQTLYRPKETMTYPTLRVGLETLATSIGVASSVTVFPQDAVARIENEISIKSGLKGEVTVYAPLLAAFDSAPFSMDDSLTIHTTGMLARLPDVLDAAVITGNQAYEHSINFQLASHTDEPALFIAEHPVTIVIGDWAACLIAEVYSPVPIGLSAAHCVAP